MHALPSPFPKKLRRPEHTLTFRPRIALEGESMRPTRAEIDLGAIAHNLAVDRLRARGRWQQGEDDADAEAISAPQVRQLETRRRVETLEAAWAELPERQAAALALVHLDGLSGSEAASVLGVSEDALESLLARARRALRAQLRKHDLLSGASQ